MKLPTRTFLVAWDREVSARFISWVPHFAADTNDDVLHRPVRRRRNLVPRDRPSHLPPDSCRPAFLRSSGKWVSR